MKTISFIGGDSQVGTSMIAQSVAEKLAEKNKRVLLVFASSNYGEEFLLVGEKSLDQLRERLMPRSEESEGGEEATGFGGLEAISQEEIEEVISFKGTMGIIGGLKKVEEARKYPVDTVDQVAKKLEGRFDYLIIDGGSNINMPLTISAMVYATKRYYVITQQEKSIRRYKHTKDLLLEPKQLKGRLIVNKYKDREDLYSLSHIEFLTEEEIAATVKFIPEEWAMEIQKETFLGNEYFEESIEEVVREILREDTFVCEKKGGGDLYDRKREPARNKRGLFFR